jgi:hypothetical protein
MSLSIQTQPESQELVIGADATFSIVAVGGLPPVSYQWRKDTVNIAGEVSDTLLLTAIQLSDFADYTCLVTDGGGSLLSDISIK